jgi:hypothetical protein
MGMPQPEPAPNCRSRFRNQILANQPEKAFFNSSFVGKSRFQHQSSPTIRTKPNPPLETL